MSGILSSPFGGLAVAALIGIACLVAPGSASAGRTFREEADILPAATSHPLDAKMRSFMEHQASFEGFKPSGLSGRDYLRIINRQVRMFKQYQDSAGAIIDPVEKIEWQYSTPCYALSVGLLAASGYTRDRELIESGIRAMNQSVVEMHENRCAQNHGEFFIQPIMLALDLYEKFAPADQVAEWKRKISEIDPYALYPDNLRRKEKCYNHNVVALAGEYLRTKKGLEKDKDFLETHMKHHEQYLTPLGMYKDNPGLPMVYDEFTRQYLSSILVEGYHGPAFPVYRDALWKGAWTSLFMQSPFGECPIGGRSAQHIWNEAECCVTYEIYAAQYAAKGKTAEAGAFKRAAHLSLNSIQRWLKPDGSGYVVKNRYPPEARHGYERYSAQSQYNLLACWLMAVAYLYADESIAEKPCPADIGGFVVPIIEDFHKVFANAGGTYVEYETRHDVRYNPTGLIRCHIKGSNPQIGPSDGIVHTFDSKTKEDLGGENMSVGPAWKDSSGKERRLADYNLDTPAKVEILEETPEKVRFRVIHEGDMDGVTKVTETISVDAGGITIEDKIEGGVDSMRVYYPMTLFDGAERSKIEMAKDSVTLSLRDGSVRFRMIEPAGIELARTGKPLVNRNGELEGAYADVHGLRAVYRIEKP